MNLGQLKHPCHVLKDALDARAQREDEHLARLRQRALERQEARKAAEAAGQPPPALPGPR